MVVVAQFSKAVGATAAAFNIALGVLLPVIISYPPSWSPYVGKPLAAWEFLLMLCSPVLIYGGCTVLYEMTFRQSRAIWIDNEDVAYVDTYWNLGVAKVKRDKIIAVSNGTIGPLKQEAIVIELEDGRWRSVRTWLLSEPSSTIIPRLKANIPII